MTNLKGTFATKGPIPMKTPLATAMVGCLLVGLLTSSGCVARAEYDKLMAMNRAANAEKDQALAAAQQLRVENEQLAQERDAARSALEAKNSEIALLETAKNDLQKRFDDLMAEYERLTGRTPAPPLAIMLPPELDKQLRELAEANPEVMEYLPRYGMVKLKSDLTFDKGSDQVSSSASEALAKFVQIMNGAIASKYNAYVAGHTDDLPIVKEETRRRHPDNWYLSVHRAVAVQKALATGGLTPARIGAMGFGEYHPVAPNASNRGGNALNRRVEIWIVPPDRFLTLPGI
jgi:chemotaxis protein MotB